MGRVEEVADTRTSEGADRVDRLIAMGGEVVS